ASCVSEFPIELAGTSVECADPKPSIVDVPDRCHFAEIAGRENLIGFQEILVSERGFEHFDPVFSKKLDHALTRYTVQKCSVRYGRENTSVFGKKDVRRGKLRRVAKGVTNDRVVKTPRLCVEDGARVVRIETRSLRIHRHGLQSR